ncbi:MAG TPA: ATP-binding protein [Jatrophihabitans sp.]|jgi:two-component sensor histidine kinase|uniref:ATP-binding protein n=1 Tax=Jatrophihabitans sp. TaxID=1932789 RepID=UPI002DFD788A|nr:ATP-binding protein [Jatrophihabitans sp.]
MQLRAVPASVRSARVFVTESLAAFPPETVDRVVLMVSELATNSVVHAGTDFTITLTVTGEVIRLEVADDGAGLPRLQSPGPTDPHGRGLRIVNQLATDWGSEEATGTDGKFTWFQLHVPDVPTA